MGASCCSVGDVRKLFYLQPSVNRLNSKLSRLSQVWHMSLLTARLRVDKINIQRIKSSHRNTHTKDWERKREIKISYKINIKKHEGITYIGGAVCLYKLVKSAACSEAMRVCVASCSTLWYILIYLLWLIYIYCTNRIYIYDTNNGCLSRQ